MKRNHISLIRTGLGLTRFGGMSKHMKPLLAALVTVAMLFPGSAFCAATTWIDIASGARLRALSAGAEVDGRALIGLEFQLGPGVVTYWRVPGETGFSTAIEVDGAAGARPAEIRWPLPEWELTQGFVDLVYRQSLILPVLVDSATSEALTLKVRSSVCSDICVPVSLELNLPGEQSPDAANSLRLRQALADTPIPWDGTDPPLFDIGLDPASGVLTLGYDPARIDPMRVFPSIDGTLYVFAVPDVDTTANVLRFTLLRGRGDIGWRDKPLRLTFATRNGPFEIVGHSQTR